jgi:hypothetical protein
LFFIVWHKVDKSVRLRLRLEVFVAVIKFQFFSDVTLRHSVIASILKYCSIFVFMIRQSKKKICKQECFGIAEPKLSRHLCPT